MVGKNLFAFFILLTINLPTFSQTIYRAKYNFNTAADSITYSVLLFKYNNGVNLIRLKYKDPATGKIIIAATEVEEFFVVDTDGKEDYNTLLLKVAKAKDTASGIPLKMTLPVFIYKLNPVTGFHEPKGVCTTESNPVMEASTSFESEYIAPGLFKRDLALEYFNKSDEFIMNFFGPKIRGGLTLIGKEVNTKMYVLIAADTKDKTVGEDSKTDMQKMISLYDTIRKYIGIPDANYTLKTIAGDELSQKNVLDAIAGLHRGQYDIIVFHFFGHGFRRNKTDVFPQINLISLNNITRATFTKDSLNVLANALSMQRVYEMIRSKGARLSLVFSDACNVNIGTDPISTLIPVQRGDDTWSFNPKNVRALFLNPKRFSLLANGAKNGEATWSSPKLGSFFTHSFKGTLQVYCSDAKSNANWNDLMKELKQNAIDLASKKCCFCCGPQCTTKVFCRLSPVFTVQ